MERKITCIICPKGCTMVASEANGQWEVRGNTCPKGAQYAVAECTAPVRTVTSTVRVSNREDTMVSVKTAAPIPKGNMADVMALLRKTQVAAPVYIGQVILENVFGTQIVITKNVE